MQKPLTEGVNKIETPAQAEAWLRHLLKRLRNARNDCNSLPFGGPARTVGDQLTAADRYWVAYGVFAGAAKALVVTGKITETTFELFTQEAKATLTPTRLVLP